MKGVLLLLASGYACAGIIVTPGPRLDLSVLAGRAVSPDNTCGKTGVGGGSDGYSCPSDLPCCSVHGYCGSTQDYCLTSNGCQAGFGNCTAPTSDTTSPDMTCGLTGAGTQGYKCPSESACCSSAGWCGSTADYCSDGCQTGFGTCNIASPTGTTPSPTTTAGTSTDGQCGTAFGTCASNECCSPAGYCGTTEDYCRAPDCQTAFGPACDANLSPAGASTSSIARPLLGSVAYGGAGIYNCVTPGTIAITYDDGPYIYTDHILDLFAQYNAKATFFITGTNNAKGQIDNASLPWPATIRRMYADNHQIASHTWSHADLSAITSDQRKAEMYKNEMALRNILGVIPTYMRPPYSSCTAASGCEADMQALGYHVSYFDLDTADYLNDSPTLIENSKNIFTSALNGKNVADSEFLVIAHDIHNQTANTLTEFMLQNLAAKGYKSVTIGDCLGDPKANWWDGNSEVPEGHKTNELQLGY